MFSNVMPHSRGAPRGSSRTQRPKDLQRKRNVLHVQGRDHGQASILKLDVLLVRLISMHVVLVFRPKAIVHRDRQPKAVLPSIVITAGSLHPTVDWSFPLHDVFHFKDHCKQSGTVDLDVFRSTGVRCECDVYPEDGALLVESDIILSKRSRMKRAQMIVEPANRQTLSAVIDATQKQSLALNRCFDYWSWY